MDLEHSTDLKFLFCTNGTRGMNIHCGVHLSSRERDLSIEPYIVLSVRSWCATSYSSLVLVDNSIFTVRCSHAVLSLFFISCTRSIVRSMSDFLQIDTGTLCMYARLKLTSRM